jgi:hypothetical protein
MTHVTQPSAGFGFPSIAAETFLGQDSRARLDWACGEVLIGVGAGEFRAAVQRVIETAMGAAYVAGQRSRS